MDVSCVGRAVLTSFAKAEGAAHVMHGSCWAGLAIPCRGVLQPATLSTVSQMLRVATCYVRHMSHDKMCVDKEFEGRSSFEHSR